MAGFSGPGCRRREEGGFLLGAETEECDKTANRGTGGPERDVGQSKRRETVVG